MDTFDAVSEIIADIFDDDTLELTPDTLRDDIPDWDSMVQIQLISAVEKTFDFKFDMEEIERMHQATTIADIIDVIDAH